MSPRFPPLHRSVLLPGLLMGTQLAAIVLLALPAAGETAKKPEAAPLPFPPRLPSGQAVATDASPRFIERPAYLAPEVQVAKTPPRIDFLYYPGQDYPGNPWSNWGDSLAVGEKYYASIGDHLALGGKQDPAHGSGTGRVFEYDPTTLKFRLLADVAQVLNLPKGHYTPGKIHGRLDLGGDGWLYFSTHRGSTKVTTAANHYRGDWILRCDPATGKTEVVAQGPVPMHCIPASVLDPDRLIFYGGTAPGVEKDGDGVQFLAYDLRKRSVLYAGPNGPPRYLMFARSTGRVYYVPGQDGAVGPLVRFDPAKPGAPERIDATLGVRAATQETAAGTIYTVSKGGKDEPSRLYAFHTATERSEDLGPAAVGSATYITSIDADATGRYLYYVPGAHGGAERDGTPVVQFDTRARTRKVIAFLHPFYQETHGATLVGTFSSALSPAGDILYVTWNVIRGVKTWDSCALSVIHIPASERLP